MKKFKACVAVLGTVLIVTILTLVLLADGPTVTFTKTLSNTSPRVGDIFTVTLEFANTYTAPLQVRVSDPNPAPTYLSIMTSTISGGAVYSPTINAVVWEGQLNVGSLPEHVKFQMHVTGIPTAAIASGYPVTNTAYMVDLNPPGSLPGSLPNQTASAALVIRPQAEFVSINTTTNPDGSLTLNTAVNTTAQDNQLRIELQAGTVISSPNMPAGGVQFAYTSNNSSDPTDTDQPFAGRRFVLELLSQTPPYTPITPVSFDPPIVFTAFYDPSQLAQAHILPSEIKLQYRHTSSTTWDYIPEADIIERGTGTTIQNSYVKFKVAHLTDFVLVGPLKLYLPLVSVN